MAQRQILGARRRPYRVRLHEAELWIARFSVVGGKSCGVRQSGGDRRWRWASVRSGCGEDADARYSAIMAHTLWNDDDRRALDVRLSKLQPDAKGLWGNLDAPRMLCHVTDAVRSATGDVVCTPKPSPLRYPPINSLVMFYLPWPKGAPTAVELISRQPENWDVEISRFRSAVGCTDQTPEEWRLAGTRRLWQPVRGAVGPAALPPHRLSLQAVRGVGIPPCGQPTAISQKIRRTQKKPTQRFF